MTGARLCWEEAPGSRPALRRDCGDSSVPSRAVTVETATLTPELLTSQVWAACRLTPGGLTPRTTDLWWHRPLPGGLELQSWRRGGCRESPWTFVHESEQKRLVRRRVGRSVRTRMDRRGHGRVLPAGGRGAKLPLPGARRRGARGCSVLGTAGPWGWGGVSPAAAAAGGLVPRAVPPAEQVPSLRPLLPGDGRAKPPRHRELQREEQTLAGSAGHSAPCAGPDFCRREPESRRFSAADRRIGTHTGSKQIPLHVHVRLVRHCHAGEKRRTGGLTAVPIYCSLDKRAVSG